jgi:hypothetical protein
MAYSYAPALILSIDSAKGTSGSTLLVPHLEMRDTALRGRSPILYSPRPHVRSYTLEHYCEVKTQADHENCVMHLFARAAELGLPPIVVAETWTPHGKWGFDAVLGMGEGWGWWTAEMRRALEAHPELGPLHVERVVPNQWRDDLFGKDRVKGRSELKKFAVEYVSGRLGVRLASHDVAESACLGVWGAQNDNVHRKVESWHRAQAKRRLAAEKAAGLR